MARRLLRDASPTVADIIDGKHDEVLDAIAQAVAFRLKQRDRIAGVVPGSRFMLTDGREGTIIKVNPKRYVGHFDGDENFREFAIPKPMVASTTPCTPQERAEHLAKIQRDPKGNIVFPAFPAFTG